MDRAGVDLEGDAGLLEADRTLPPDLDEESAEELRALGYLD